MSGNQTHGFDIVLEMGLTSFLNLLHSTVIDDLPLRLSHVDFSLPVTGAVFQNGFVSLPNRPTVDLTVSAAGNAFTLDLTFGGTQLSLEPVAAILGVVGAIAGIPLTGAGNIHARLQLTINAALSGASNDITIAATSITVDPPSALPALPTGVVAATLNNAINTAVRSALQSVFPITLPIALPLNAGCPPVGMIPFVPKLLPAASGGVASLAFLFARAGVTGNGAAITSSSIAIASGGIITVANGLLRDVLCCLLPPVLSLPTTPSPSGACCTWPDMDNVTFAGTSFSHVRNLRVCVGGTGVTFSGMLINEGFGWHANLNFTMTARLRNDAGAIVPALDPPGLSSDVGIEWWVWLIAVLIVIVLAAVGAVLGFFAGGPLGAVGGGIAGFLVGFLIAGLVVGVIAGAAAAAAALVGPTLSAVRGALGNLFLLPPDLTSRFGTLSIIGDPVIDDLRMRGVIAGNDPHPARASGADQVLLIGDRFDLDRGVVLAPDEQPMEADLEWLELRISGGRRGFPLYWPHLSSQNAARLAQLHVNFFSLTERDVAAVTYPGGASSIVGFAIPVSDHEPSAPCVFVVRTTAGRYAKCAAWRDSYERLHLRYHTYDTPLPLTLQSTWIERRGAQVGSGFDLFESWEEYEVERNGHITAHPSTSLATPIAYRWYWNGAIITGGGTLAGTSTSFTVSGATCDLVTAMGTPLNGELCAEATDHAGTVTDACAEFRLRGTTRVVHRSHIFDPITVLQEIPIYRRPEPDPDPDFLVTLPIMEQMVSALAVGMKVAPEQIEFH